MPIRRSAFQVLAESAKRAVRKEPKLSKPEGSPANAPTPAPSEAASPDSPSQSRNKNTIVNKTPIRTPQSGKRRKRPPASTGTSVKPSAFELVAAAQASPPGARKPTVKPNLRHSPPTEPVPQLNHAKPAPKAAAELGTVHQKIVEAQVTPNNDPQSPTNDSGSQQLISAVGGAESVSPITVSPISASGNLHEGAPKPPPPAKPPTSSVVEPSGANGDKLSRVTVKIPTDELKLSHNEGIECRDASTLTSSLPDSNATEPQTNAVVQPLRPSADELSQSKDKIGNTELKRIPKKVVQPQEHGRSAFDLLDPFEPAMSPATENGQRSSLDKGTQSLSPPQPRTKPRRQPDEIFKHATLKKVPSAIKQTPRSEFKLINPSSPEALVAMAEALERSQAQQRLAKTAGGKLTDTFSKNPTTRSEHRTVDLGSLHGNTFTAFLIGTLCEIFQFIYTSTPSTPLRLINLVLAVSLYSGVFDTHVQRAPLGMMLNRLAAWIVALLALSTSIYTTPGEYWRTGEVLLVNMFGTLLFPLAVLDSISVLWAEIRCRNFILNGFATENLYIYVLLLSTPIVRFLLTYEEAAALYMSNPLAETIYAVSVFSALIVAVEYYCVCQVAAGNFSKDVWQGIASILWGFLHAPGCAVLVGLLNGMNTGAYFYVGCFFVFLGGKALEFVLEKSGGIQYRDTSTAPMTAKKVV